MNDALDRELSIRTVDATPYAASLVEGHRDFGYSLDTALADIIDNAITAGSKSIKLMADTVAEEPWIALADDGCGMEESELVEAMRLGSKNPLDKRNRHDLGRFGLGLKSASFSQCRKLTVLTKRNEKISCARWDLDRIAHCNDWSLELIDNPQTLPSYDLLGSQGTVVVWEVLDRMNGGYANDRVKRAEYMNGELTRAERHLRLVFHRFLEGTKPRVRLSLNGRELKPIDPMASTHPATQKDPDDFLKLKHGDVRVRCYTLPHHNRMTSDQWDEVGGPEGHLKTQGLYVYREDRLIIAGGWLGLTRQTELTKLCRIAVDIPNTMDSEWKIDVKKASAQLPPLVRERLKTVIERFVGTSKRTYRAKGQRLVDETRFPLWSRLQIDGKIVFRPNMEHPLLTAYTEQLSDALREGFERCIRLVGAGLPIEALHAEIAGNAEEIAADKVNERDLREFIHTLALTLTDNGVPKSELPDVLKSNPFLKARWESAEPILNDLLKAD
ncbi:ATP-binding protein [Aestuariivirga litoralis]|uniref:ATP-binding protein n=1 Tax=Aestuariivirga litoralis TaxID=2650924 RepID=A0A2W2BI41_9HYPH|nr:ATP-binding protein [Aestuariivirga litoralis]PZF75839.1 ATP-binding protein [Aestuariivirga litoralis]